MTKSLLDEFLMTLSIKAIPNIATYTGEIFHYTALKNIDPILLHSQDSLVLWASQFDCLNDLSEGTVADKIYLEVCNKLKTELLISEELFNLFSTVKSSRNETFIITEKGKVKPYRGEYTAYIASFSRLNDLLPMWNYYSKGDMFEGINLGIDAECMNSSLGSIFTHGKILVDVQSVIYSKAEQETLIRDFLLQIARKYNKRYDPAVRALISMRLTSWKMLFKQEDFQHEQEVRIIVKIANKYKDILPVKYRTNAGYVIPYIELKLKKAALKSVTLGPFRGTDSQKKLQIDVLHNMLFSNGYNASINCSQIPVRY